MFRNKGLMRVDVIVIVVVLGLGSVILLQGLGNQRRTANSMKPGPPIRGIIQGCIFYSADHGTYYPGVLPNGDNDQSSPPSTGYTYSRANDSRTGA